MTAHEALWLLKATLQKNEQNLEAIRVLEGVVKSIYRVHIDEDYGTEAKHMLNHMNKVAKKDIQELSDNMCARYDWAEDDDVVVYYDLCDTIGGEDD